MGTSSKRKAQLRAEKLKLQASYCKKGSVLDVGFSAKPNVYLENAIGVDISLPKQKLSNYSQVVQCNLNRDALPFERETFDNVIAGDVIEHLENPSFFLREVNRVMKESGKLVLSTPHANDWWTTLHNWFFRKWINDPDPGEHLQNWTVLDMTRLLRKNGFQVDFIEGFYMHFPKISLQIRVRRLPMLSWQIFYIATKVGAPDTTVLVNIDEEWRKIEQ